MQSFECNVSQLIVNLSSYEKTFLYISLTDSKFQLIANCLTTCKVVIYTIAKSVAIAKTLYIHDGHICMYTA